ncbi:chromodomain helicase DNA binding protein 9 [Phyllostomus discolor]|nr:chromodomain helicase DNA binding protein 9 [Phyllostomus discolor]
MSKEGGLKLTFQKQGLAQKRPLDSEDCALGQQQYLARLRELQSASETSLANFPKSVPVSGTSIQSTLGANGVILDNQPVVKKRRGRRKNVEGVDILFFNKNKPPNHVTLGLTTSQVTAGIHPALSYSQPQGVPDTESPVPVIHLKDGTRLAGDDAPKRKDLEKWLKEHPGYVEDLGAFIPRMQLHEGRPKQKRHRCRNPNKLDVNSLTGEERVQLINRRNARKVGGAFAPPLKDLCRFLKENSEYGVAPEWGDVVKQSGFLPESMYERILTGPVVREEVSRRGRRPKSGIAKATAAAAATAPSVAGNPLLANGLLPGMDLTTLQALQQNLQNLQSLQVTAGLMGMPAGLSSGGEAKNVATMFPMLLSGVTGLPNLLGMGGLLTKPTESGTEEKKGNDSKELDGNKERTESQNSENGGENSVSSSPSTSSTAALNTAAAANSLALNPLLLSNILYPGMLLTPGLNLHIPALSQPNTFDVQKSKSSDLGSSKSVEVKEEDSRVSDQEDKGGPEPSPLNENSTDEGSEKADASSTSDSAASSSEDSDSSNED